MSIDSKLINMQGDLLKIAKEFDLSTLQHSRNIQKDRLIDASYHGIRDKTFRTGDFSLYTLEDNEAILYLFDIENNLIFKNLNEAVSQIKERKNYFPDNSEVDKIISSPNKVRINLYELELIGSNEEIKYFKFSTANKVANKEHNYDLLNPTQRILAERAYGSGKDFEKSMDMIANDKVEQTAIYVLNPEYVKQVLKDTSAKSIARFSRLNHLEKEGRGNFNSSFTTCCSQSDVTSFYLRGIPIEKPEKK